MEKICGFYVSNAHLVTMILPFLKKQITKGIKIQTFFEQNLKKDINIFLSNLLINENDKNDILNINWKSNKIKKYNNIAINLKNILLENNETIILISGNKNYIKETNILLNKFFEKNNKKNIKIINLYKVTEFDDDIKEILEEHEYIFNTSGIYKIEEVFEDYRKEIVN